MSDDLSQLAGILGAVTAAMDAMDWAEDEIAKAIERHPDHRDALYHSFSLIAPSGHSKAMFTEFVFRSHAAELLDRVALGKDTRPATAAELIAACSEASLIAPLHDAVAGLYFRLWMQAFPDHPETAKLTDKLEFYEVLFSSRIDEIEADLRHRAVNWNRVLGDIECPGKHHGEPVDCQFAKGVA